MEVAELADPTDYCFVMIKPDGVERGLIGKVISKLEEKGLSLVRVSIGVAPRDKVEALYKEHMNKGFFVPNADFICSGPVVISVWKGQNASKYIRNLIGNQSTPGSIRGDFTNHIQKNIVHASDSPEAARREITLWFPDLVNFFKDS